MSNETRLYAVSSGNGNDGVSHMFPDYYVRTNDPYRLAALAMVSSFDHKFKKAAADACEIDGESDYTISATIYNPEDVDPSEAVTEMCCSDCGYTWTIDGEIPNDLQCPKCESDAVEQSDLEMYCNINGAWQIIDVFPDNEPKDDRPTYDSLEECFGEDDLKLVPSDM
jgi:hypothetical protein